MRSAAIVPVKHLRPVDRQAPRSVPARLRRPHRPRATIVRRSGSDNDLYDLIRTFPALTSMALDTKERSYDPGGGAKSVGRTQRAFPEIGTAPGERAVEVS